MGPMKFIEHDICGTLVHALDDPSLRWNYTLCGRRIFSLAGAKTAAAPVALTCLWCIAGARRTAW